MVYYFVILIYTILEFQVDNFGKGQLYTYHVATSPDDIDHNGWSYVRGHVNGVLLHPSKIYNN